MAYATVEELAAGLAHPRHRREHGDAFKRCIDAAAVEIDHEIDLPAVIDPLIYRGRPARQPRQRAARRRVVEGQRRRLRRHRFRPDRGAAGAARRVQPPRLHADPAQAPVGRRVSTNGALRLSEVRPRRPPPRSRPPDRRRSRTCSSTSSTRVPPPAIMLHWDDPWLEPESFQSMGDRLVVDARLHVLSSPGGSSPAPASRSWKSCSRYAIGRMLADCVRVAGCGRRRPRARSINGVPLLGGARLLPRPRDALGDRIANTCPNRSR